MCAARSAAVALALTLPLSPATATDFLQRAAANRSLQQGVAPTCESLSQTDPARCPRVQGGSGAYINTDLTCVYNPGCISGAVSLNCFEHTGCQYKYK